MIDFNDLFTLDRKPIVRRERPAANDPKDTVVLSRREIELARLRRMLADMIVHNEARRRTGVCLA